MGNDADGADTVQVKTRVPAHQRTAWREDADALGMSQSEFVRTMVQAGRSGFEPAEREPDQRNPEEPQATGTNPGGDALESRVRAALSAEAAIGWDELVETVLGEFEERLEEITQEAEEIRYSGRKGGYVLDDGE